MEEKKKKKQEEKTKKEIAQKKVNVKPLLRLCRHVMLTTIFGHVPIIVMVKLITGKSDRPLDQSVTPCH